MSELKEDASILIILMGSIGDVVRGLALLEALRQKVPRARISWLVEPKCHSLLKMHKGIDEVLLFDRSSPLKGVLKLRHLLRERRFDVTLDLQRHLKSGFFSLLSAAPRRIGFHKKNAKEGNWLFNNERIPFFDHSLNKFCHYFKFLDYLGLGACKADPLLSDWALEVPELELPAKRSVGLVLKSSWESKDWPEEYYKSLLEKLLRFENAGAVLLGDAVAVNIAQRLMKVCDEKRVLNLAGKTSLEEMLGVIRRISVCVGPDSGPGHIAAALGTPYLALFGPTSPQRTAPLGQNVEVFYAKAVCAPCYKRVCPGLGQVCMTALKPDMVFERLVRYLEE